ncbi:MAG TPA: DUF4410 domain-containing protein [Methylomirabilota bacterium]
MAMRRLAPLALVVALALAGCYGAQQTRPDNPVAVGSLKPVVEDKDAGLVGLAPGFNVKSYQVIAVEPFPVTDPAIKDERDRKLASSMSTFLQGELVRRLRETGVFTRVVNLAETTMPAAQERTLKLQGTITRLGEGSQALRMMWGAYGAGRTRTQVEMRFVDTRTGDVKLVTADRRIASVGMWGGDSKDHLKESYDDMARDLAKFIARLSRGETPAAK